jgi:hypothetical protein
MVFGGRSSPPGYYFYCCRSAIPEGAGGFSLLKNGPNIWAFRPGPGAIQSMDNFSTIDPAIEYCQGAPSFSAFFAEKGGKAMPLLSCRIYRSITCHNLRKADQVGRTL